MKKFSVNNQRPVLGSEFNYKKRTISELFSDQVVLTPEAAALVFDDKALTYRELNQHVNQLAHILIARGFQAGDHVGLALPRSNELFIVLLALIRLRLVFVSLDPEYPITRIAHMIEHGRIKNIIASSRIIDEWSKQKAVARLSAQYMDVQNLVEQASEYSPSELALSPPGISDRLYLLFTSGSTGVPKAVEMGHEPISQLIQWQIAEHQDIGPLRTLQFTSMNFDVSIQEIFTTLCSGGTLVVIKDTDRRDSARLYQLLIEYDIQRLFLPYVALQQLATQASVYRDQQPPLKVVVTAGEALIITDAIRTWFQLLSGADLVNQYGPTETHVVVTQHVLSASDVDHWPRVPPIGKPLANIQCLILDEHGAPVNAEEVGAFYVGGHKNLAEGYWLNPKLTDEKFVRLPSGERYYVTGDLVAIDAQGNIAYHGRDDQQVKIRGHRVELGEIEAGLQADNRVALAAVVAVTDKSGAQHLCAYIVVRQGEHFSSGDQSADDQIDVEDIKHDLAQRLPEFMVPQKIIPLECLPITPSGKTDRKALKQLSTEKASQSEHDWQDECSRTIAGIWQDTLGLGSAHPDQNFFSMGGHSLLATQLLVDLEKNTDVHVTLSELLLNPRLHDVIEIVKQKIEGAIKSDTKAFSLDKFAIIHDVEQRYAPFLLTDVQQAYWLGRNPVFELGNISTHIYSEIDVVDLDIPCCEQAWNILVDQQDMLRAVVLTTGEQQVLEQVPYYSFTQHDFSKGDNPQALRQALRDKLSHKILDPHRWPLFDIHVSDDGKTRCLHIGLDILIVDAQSQYALAAQWFEYYEALRSGESKQALIKNYLAPALTFRDYLLAEQAFKSIYRQQSWEYWEKRVDTLPPPPALPLACSPSAIKSPKFVRREGRLDVQQWQELQARSRELGLTPSVVLLTLFAEVLESWSHRADFTINLTLFNRLPVHADVNRLIGDFTSITLLQIDASERQFVALAQEIQSRLWQDLDHRLVSGIEVLRELNHRSTSDAVISMPIVFTSALGLGKTKEFAKGFRRFGEQTFAITQTSQTWLDHQVMECDGELIFLWDAVEALFPEGLLDAMFDVFQMRLSLFAMSEKPWHEQRSTRLLPAAQRERRQKYNDTVVPYQGHVLHNGFIEQVRQAPDSPAIYCSDKMSGDKIISYRELYNAAQQLAQLFVERGLKTEDKVIVCLPKSWQQVAAVFGILMVGGIYVPVDVRIPSRRLMSILTQTQAKFAVCEQGNESDVFPKEISCLHVEDAWLTSVSDTSIHRDIHLDQLAYIIFTSGSTGVPKGVALTHGSVLNTLIDINDRISLARQDRVFALSSLAFDLSVYDIFGTLSIGAALVMPDEEEYKDPVRWVALMQKTNVTIWNSVPTLFHMLTEYLSENAASSSVSLRVAMLSGDWIPLTLPAKARALWPDLTLFSLGGATEAAIWSIFYPIENVDSAWPSIPYGKPLNNQKIFILDAFYEDCPEWVVGDIYIGGEGLAHSYFGDEEKTAASFIKHPRRAERLYKTGDLGCFLPCGNVRFLGRSDSQVKISGHRIELNEIDRVIRLNKQVVRSHIQIVESDNKKMIAAFLQLQQKCTDSSQFIQQLMNDIGNYLPDYMLPSYMEVIEAWPLTSNGKMDSAALQKRVVSNEKKLAENVYTNNTSMPFNNLVEQKIARIWCELLKQTQIRTTDNFFTVGGDSLLATRLYNCLMKEFSGFSHLTVIHLFQHPTIATQAGLFVTGSERHRAHTENASIVVDQNRSAKRRQRMADFRRAKYGKGKDLPVE